MTSPSFAEILEQLIVQQGTWHANVNSLPPVSRPYVPGLESIEAVSSASPPVGCYATAADADEAGNAGLCDLDISQALNLSDDLTPPEIEAIRRRFAKRNHPDLFGATYQDVALRRMQIANDLIDKALAKRRNSNRS